MFRTIDSADIKTHFSDMHRADGTLSGLGRVSNGLKSVVTKCFEPMALKE